MPSRLAAATPHDSMFSPRTRSLNCTSRSSTRTFARARQLLGQGRATQSTADHDRVVTHQQRPRRESTVHRSTPDFSNRITCPRVVLGPLFRDDSERLLILLEH